MITCYVAIYLPEGIADADLVLLITTRPTTGNTLAWAVACERDQWGRAIAGKLKEFVWHRDWVHAFLPLSKQLNLCYYKVRLHKSNPPKPALAVVP